MKQIKIFLLLAVALTVASCGTTKRLAYIQDMEPDVTYSMPAMPDPVIAKGDKLSIIVTCSTPALAAPFNLVSGVNTIDPTSSTISTSTNTSTGDSQGYTVDAEGDMNFPVLGRMHVEGMTLKQLKDKIEGQLISRRFIKDPVVLVSFMNFKITILGEAAASVYSYPDGRVNIFDALAQAGDLTEDAIRSEVWVVRTVDGKRRLYTIDLKTKDCYYSPAFYLQQNDMLYVRPRNSKFDTVVNNRWTVVNAMISVFSATLNFLVWSNYLSR